VNIVSFDYYVTRVDTDPELDPGFFGDFRVVSAHYLLNFESTAHSIHGTWKFDQDAVAHSFDDTPAVGGNPGVDQLGIEGLQARACSFLVSLHQSGISDHVGHQDRR
jgi:hypothetical protein